MRISYTCRRLLPHAPQHTAITSSRLARLSAPVHRASNSSVQRRSKTATMQTLPSMRGQGLRAPRLPVRVQRTMRPVLAQAGDPNKPLQANQTGTLSSQSGTVMVLSRVEEARKYFRTVYDFPQWQKHRSQYRLIDRLLQIPQSHIIQNIVPSLAWVGGVSTLVVAYMYAYEHGALPDGFPSLAPNQACQAFISNTSVALSLLLVFRTNASYGRWDEARKMWGGLLNRSRDIMRQGATLFPDDQPEAKKALARWMVGFARALRIHFQPEVTLESELQNILTPKELEMLKAAPHRPVKAIHAMSQVIQNVPMHPIHQQQMSANLTFFHDVLGGCERLLRAPIPVSYTRHTARFLFFWLTLLPFALYGSVGPWTVPVVIGISAVLCGIEEIGVQCEEPFGILPLDVICNRIQADVMNTLKDDEDTKAVLLESMGLTAPVAAALPPPTATPAPTPTPTPVTVSASVNGSSNGSANGNGNGKPRNPTPRRVRVLTDFLE